MPMSKLAATKSSSTTTPPNPALSMAAVTTNPSLNGTKTASSASRKAQAKDDPAAALRDASSAAEIRATLAGLHTRESALSSRLTALVAAQQDISRSLARLDNLRAGLGAQVIATRGISNSMLAGASETAAHLSSRVRTLDLEKQRVEDTLRVVEQVAELKACVAGVVGSMGAPQDWEAAAGYIARAAKVPEDIARGGFAAAVVPTVEVPDPPWVTLETSKQSLCGLFLREFERAAAESDWARVTRFFKLFPLIGRGDVGLDVYGLYVCQGVAGTARAVLKEGGGQGKKDGLFYANALTRLFKHIADIVDGHGGLVERYYGAGKMIKVIERLQVEADVQGGIILDSWTDERAVTRRLTDVKSYPFSFLVQSFLPQSRGFGGTPRVNSPAQGNQANETRNSEDEGVNLKEVDGLITEIAAILGQWFFYSRFLAAKCKDPESPEDAPLSIPDVLTDSNLSKKVSSKLVEPYKVLTQFFIRRSVEKAFQLDESPAGLSLSMSRHIESNPPFIISAVDDVMYIVNTVIFKSISTSQRAVVDHVIPLISTLLGNDFIGMIQRKMRDESYPRAIVQGGFPPEDRIVAFIVLINSLDMSNEYISRIVTGLLGASEQTNGSVADAAQQQTQSSLKEAFPFKNDAKDVATRLNNLNTSFSSRTTELLNEGISVLFERVIKPRLRPVLTDTFRDADYTLTEDELAEIAAQNEEEEDDVLEQVPRRFEHGWDALMKPVARLMTPRTFSTVLDRTARYLAGVLEKRVWSYAGGRTSPYGAVRMERDFNGIVGAITKGNYSVRELFAKTTQILMVANMEEDEWDELVAAEEEDPSGAMLWVLTKDERRKARTMVKA